MEMVGIIGSGLLGSALAYRLTQAGYGVVLANSRGPESLTELVEELGPNARAGTLSEVSSQPIVIYASKWTARQEILGSVANWDGRILVDAGNHYLTHLPDFQRDVLIETTGSEVMAALAPGARVVKALNTINFVNVRAGGNVNGGTRVMFLSGDDADAKAEVAKLIKAIGFHPMDLGSLKEGGAMHQLGSPMIGREIDLIQAG
jgi:predicted dinucleotide-binding enzyme